MKPKVEYPVLEMGKVVTDDELSTERLSANACFDSSPELAFCGTPSESENCLHGPKSTCDQLAVNSEWAKKTKGVSTAITEEVLTRYHNLKHKVFQELCQRYYRRWLFCSMASRGTKSRLVHQDSLPSSLKRTGGTHDIGGWSGTKDSIFYCSESLCGGCNRNAHRGSICSNPDGRVNAEQSSSYGELPSVTPHHFKSVSIPLSARSPSPFEGIAATTVPSKLLDYGTKSDLPQRRSITTSDLPYTGTPAVVPNPVRIYRVQ
ncbi:unnamed protein product [Phytomonas sp. EM1]|nr:unnamed protein product [Phytomonas sp. EM1]|eukprot:CCW65731.1 unnamed protein product [Phytomonas sp. isolate EM1]